MSYLPCPSYFALRVLCSVLDLVLKGAITSWQEFNYGVEFVLLIAFAESSLGGSAEDALASLAKLMTEFPSLIVQATQGFPKAKSKDCL